MKEVGFHSATRAGTAEEREGLVVHVWRAAVQVLAVSGCAGATREIWEPLHAEDCAELPLQSLSAVGCKSLRSCWLGLQPAQEPDRAAQDALLSIGMYSPPVSVSTAWREVPVALTRER